MTATERLGSSPPRCPEQVLEGTPHEREQYFHARLVAHEALVTVDRRLLDHIHSPQPAQLVLVFGPTGVGKTTVAQHVERAIIAERAAELAVDRGCIPVVNVLAPAEGTAFNWRSFYISALEALQEPLIDRKMLFDGATYVPTKPGPVRRSGHDPYRAAPELRRALIQSLAHRGTTVLIIDEAQHIGRVSGGHTLQDQLDSLKSLALSTQTLLVLVGTYDLLAFRGLSGELSRRSVDLHFPRYHIDIKEEVTAFQALLWALQRLLPVEQEPNLLEHWEWLFERTLGLAGPLKDWLARALHKSIQEDARSLTFAHLHSSAPTLTQALGLSAGLREAEEALQESDDHLVTLRQALRSPSRRPRELAYNAVDRDSAAAELGKPAQSLQPNSHPPAPSASGAGRQRRGQPGVRTPRRDTTGRSSLTGHHSIDMRET